MKTKDGEAKFCQNSSVEYTTLHVLFAYIWRRVFLVCGSVYLWWIIWAMSVEKNSYSICKQQRFRRACTCAVLPESMLITHVSGRPRENFSQRTWLVVSQRGWAWALKDWFVGMFKEPFSCHMAHFTAWKLVVEWFKVLCYKSLVSHTYWRQYGYCVVKLPAALRKCGGSVQ